MAVYSESYMREHCIDVYFRYRNTNMHVLTDGNCIPGALNDRVQNRGIQQVIANMVPDIVTLNSIHIQRTYLNLLRNSPIGEMVMPENEVLLRMFAPMAQLGFYSYDCIRTREDGKGIYMLVASPDYTANVIAPTPEVQLPMFNEIEVLEEEKGVVIRFAM